MAEHDFILRDNERFEETSFRDAVRQQQQKLVNDLQPQYDFVICGAGSSGSVIARRLAEHPEVTVLLLEAGGGDDRPSMVDPDKWVLNLGTDADWNYSTEAEPQLNGRVLPYSMGRALGGGSAINATLWVRGHRADWDFFAEVAGDPAWSYRSVLDVYKRIESWHGEADPEHRGSQGPVHVDLRPESSVTGQAFLEASANAGIPSFNSLNGSLMESHGGGSIAESTMRAKKRRSIFRSYTYPLMEQPNLTVVTNTLVTKINFDGKRATGIEFTREGRTVRVSANVETIISAGTVQTPKLLMQSGLGSGDQLRSHGLPVLADLPGVGENLQDQPFVWLKWEATEVAPVGSSIAQAISYWSTSSQAPSPDAYCMFTGVLGSPSGQAGERATPPAWSVLASVMRPLSRGYVKLSGPRPSDTVRIKTNFLSESNDMRVAMATAKLARELMNSTPMKPFVRGELVAGLEDDRALEEFIRQQAGTLWHQAGTAKMGTDALSVVDGQLRVHGIENLRVADASIMPRVPTANTMAPSVVVGEVASDFIRRRHGL